MSVLSDRDIRWALDEGCLVIDPRPAAEAYDTTGVDLRVGSEFFEWSVGELGVEFGKTPPIHVGSFDYTKLAKKYLRRVALDQDGCVTLDSGTFLLGSTLEKVGFPVRDFLQLAGRVEGRSSLARLGLSVHFAPTLHAGWQGNITLEFHNVGEAPLKLKAGDHVCQLIVEDVRNPPSGSMSRTRFQDQEDPRGR